MKVPSEIFVECSPDRRWVYRVAHEHTEEMLARIMLLDVECITWLDHKHVTGFYTRKPMSAECVAAYYEGIDQLDVDVEIYARLIGEEVEYESP